MSQLMKLVNDGGFEYGSSVRQKQPWDAVAETRTFYFIVIE